MSKKLFFQRRAFLNDLEANNYPSAIVGYIELEDKWLIVELTITDCSGTVRLEFDVDRNETENRNSIKKAELLADFFADWATALKEADKYYRELMEQQKEEKDA